MRLEPAVVELRTLIVTFALQVFVFPPTSVADTVTAVTPSSVHANEDLLTL